MKKTLLAISCLLTGLIAFAQPVTVTYNYTGSVQTFTVPGCVTSLTIETRGAQGGAVTGQSPFPQGGLGATMIGDFTVAPGDVLSLVVGGRGNSDPSSSGGGGGSGVNLNGNALIVAGGGAGVDFQDPSFPGQDAVITSDGITGNGGGGTGGTAGSAGGNNVYSGNNISQGGNGWNDGNTGSTGLSGTSPNTTFTSGTWGLGGGGGSVGYGWCNCGGGGGGYSGGGSGQINASGGGGGSYNTGTNQSNTAGNNTGNGIIIITYNAGGSAPSTPGAITGSAGVCMNATNLSYSISPVAGATGYTWTVPGGSTISSGQGTSSIIMQPGSSGGVISVTADNACGSSTASILTLTVNPLPFVSISAVSSAICTGSSDILTGMGASTYIWNTGGTNTTETVSPTTMTTYTVTGTDANGCSDIATFMVDVNPLPVVNLGSDITQCGGGVTLDAQNAGSTFMWNDASTNQTLSASTSGTYSVTVTDGNGCQNSDAINVTINVLPVVDLGADINQCGGTLTLDAGNTGATYLWNNASTNQLLIVSSSGTYSVVVTDGNGCQNSDAIIVAINTPPAVSLGNDITQCGGTVTLNAQNAGASYLWSNSSTSQSITVTASGTYSVMVTDVNNCTGSDAINVTIHSLPTVTGTASSTTVCVNDANVSLTGTPSGGTWSGAGVSASTFNPMTAGNGAHTLTYTFTDVNGCTNTATTVVTVNACTGVAEQNLFNAINIFPNPNNGEFTLAVNADLGDLNIVITDLQGRVLYTSVETNIHSGFVKQISLDAQASGIYFIQISGGGQQRTEKITVQK